MIDVRALRSSRDVEEALGGLIGEVPARDAGVIHVTSVWESPSGALHTLRIGPATPKSAHDLFLLQSTRARADAILVTGKVLRDEPLLVYALEGPGSSGPALRAYRRECLGRDEPPWLLVLTARADLDPAHPALSGWARPVVLTSPESAARLTGRLDPSIDIVALAPLGVREAIAHARVARGARTVSLEAGPSTTAPLHAPPEVVDELVLGIFRGPAPPREVLGGELPPLARLEERFPLRSVPRRVEEESGPWEFRRLRRL